MSHDGRQIWPALAIMGVGILALAVTLKAAQADMPMQPTWIMGALAGLYLVLALLAEGFHWRSLVLLAAMALTHAFTALLMGWGYAAVEGNPRALIPALQHGLWDYLPGTALQFGFACLVGIALDVRLEPEVEDAEEEAGEPEAEPVLGPELSGAADLPAALAAAVACSGVAGALVAADTAQAAGVWAGDPQAAWGRVRAMVARGGTGLHSLPLGDVSLLIRSEDGHTAAILVTAELDQPGAHDILRQLWAAGQREWGTHE
ncbi:MAG: hypothetical protein KKI08_13750 [Armatimonadetes bacterium]|nr:hypothetical protein [Armatimonadota bacterium]